MNYSLSTSLYAIFGVVMFSLSGFAQEVTFHDLSIVQLGSHQAHSTNDVAFLMDEIPTIGPIVDLGPRGPGPFLPETDTENTWNLYGPVIMGGIVVGNPADTLMEPGKDEVQISNGFLRVAAIEAVVHGLIDIEDYLSKGGGNLQTDIVVLLDNIDDRSQEEKLVLVIPQDDPEIDPATGLLLPPWHEKGYVDHLKERPTDDDRFDHPLDR